MAAGTKLLLPVVGSLPGFIKLIVPMVSQNEFKVIATLTKFPRITATNGIRMLKGHSTPGEIHVNQGVGLPKNITLSTEVTIATDHIMTGSEFTIKKLSKLTSGTIFEVNSSFPSGMTVNTDVILGPIKSLGSANVFTIIPSGPFGSDMTVLLLINVATGKLELPTFDNRDLISSNQSLTERIELLEEMFANFSN